MRTRRCWETGGLAGRSGAPAPARGAPPHGPRLGDLAAPGARRFGRAGRGARPPCPRCSRRAQRRPISTDPVDAGPARRGGDAGGVAGVRGLVGPVRFDPTPQETPWTTPLDQDTDHATYDVAHVNAYWGRARPRSCSAKAGPVPRRSTPVNARRGTWTPPWACTPANQPIRLPNSFIMRNATAQMIEVGWWPGDERYPRPAFRLCVPRTGRT